MTRFVFNPTDSPVVYDAEGRTVAGGEWATVPSSDMVAEAVREGRLVKADKPAEDADKTAQDAYTLDDEPRRSSSRSKTEKE